MTDRSRRFLRHLGQALQFETVSEDEGKADPQAFDEFHRFLATTYPNVWSRLTVESVGEHALLIDWPVADPDRPGLLLLAHQDVVPAGCEQQWTHLPFAGSSDGTYLYGRGVIDDKGPLIAILETVELLLEQGFQPRAPLTIALGDDEERGGPNGARRMAGLLAERGRRYRLGIDEGGAIGEGLIPGIKSPVALIAVGEKGLAEARLTVDGEPGHSSAPPRRTAIGRLAEAVTRIEGKPMPARLELVSDLLGRLQGSFPSAARPIVSNLSRLAPLGERVLSRRPLTNALIRTTIVPTVVSGGTKSNVLPAEATAILNVRILPGDTLADVTRHVERVVGPGVEVQITGHEPPPIADPNSSEYALLAQIAGRIFPDAVVAPFVVVAATDARFYVDVTDQMLRFQPFRLNQDEFGGIHGFDERMRLTDAQPALHFYHRLIEAFCG